MAVRVAGRDDFEALVRGVLASRPSPIERWFLAPAPDVVEARNAYARWVVAELLRVGHVVIDGDGRAAGGRRLRARRWSPRPVVEDVRFAVRGPYTYPDLPRACQQRMLELANDSMRLRSSSARRTFVVQMAFADPARPADECLTELVRWAGAQRLSCLAVVADGGDGGETLESVGFRPGRRAPARGERPALVAWEHPA
jgi:hypothetical protein